MIKLDHTIVPSKDKIKSAYFLANILGLTVDENYGRFAVVRINDSLTFDFGDATSFEPHHYAFFVDVKAFSEILNRINYLNINYSSGITEGFNNKLYFENDRKGFYFQDPNGHIYEIITSV